MRGATARARLRIWLLCVGEYLPTDHEKQRKLRMSLLADKLHELGHSVTWWTSTYDHEAKRQRYHQYTEVPVAPRYELRLLHGRSYRRNISLDRLINHRQVADEFLVRSAAEPEPELIVASLPPIELAAAAAGYAQERAVPFAVDVRDQHPDIYLDLVPAIARPVARMVLRPLYRQLKAALEGAQSVTAISPSILRWALDRAGRSQSPHDVVFPIGYPEIRASETDLSTAAAECAALGVDPTKLIVWYVGTFNRWIDLGTPIEAARRLAGLGVSNLQFVFSGTGDLGDRWQEQARGLPNVVFTGWADVPKIAYLRRVAWVGLAPYRKGFNAFGNKLFEFMAAGLPIVFSIEGDAREVLEAHAAGIRYQAGNPADLVAVLAGLRSVPERRMQLSRAASDAYREFYNAETVYTRFADHLTGLALARGACA